MQKVALGDGGDGRGALMQTTVVGGGGGGGEQRERRLSGAPSKEMGIGPSVIVIMTL